LPHDAHTALKAAVQAYLALRQIASLSLEDDETAPASATMLLLLETLNEPEMSRLLDTLQGHRARVVAAFDAAMHLVTTRLSN
jgi:hypothetical protein